VENPLRPKEIQERIRAGETAEEIADAAGIPPDKIRRFEGPILAERQYQAEQARRATIPGRGDSGPGPRLGDIVAERLNRVGAGAETAEWDSRKRQDGSWQVQLRFAVGSRISTAEWIYDPRKRHVIPDDDEAVRLCLPQEEWAAITFAERQRATATVTPIGSRQHAQNGDAGREGDRWGTPGLPRSRTAGPDTVATDAAATGAIAEAPAGQGPAAAAAAAGGTDQPESAAVPAKKGTGGRSRRASVPSWDEIMFGTSRQQD
jgi:hypothetical protein